MSLIVREAAPHDVDRVLAFIEANGFTPRDRSSWDGLGLRAVTAWHGETLVGAIPFQPRSLQVGDGQGTAVVLAHETTVAVAESLRGEGIGGQMQEFLVTERPGGIEALSVYRELPDSQAYRWYRAGGFEPVMHITSWFVHAPDAVGAHEELTIAPVAEHPARAAVDVLRRRHFADVGGVVRRERPLAELLSVHAYRNKYRFALATVGPWDAPEAAVVVGIGRLHSDGDRLDVLELAASSDAALDVVIGGLPSWASADGLRPLRWALSDADPIAERLRRAGWEPGWDFEHLLRPLAGRYGLSDFRNFANRWKYQTLDYL